MQAPQVGWHRHRWISVGEVTVKVTIRPEGTRRRVRERKRCAYCGKTKNTTHYTFTPRKTF
jgi:hypothetical protein